MEPHENNRLDNPERSADDTDASIKSWESEGGSVVEARLRQSEAARDDRQPNDKSVERG